MTVTSNCDGKHRNGRARTISVVCYRTFGSPLSYGHDASFGVNNDWPLCGLGAVTIVATILFIDDEPRVLGPVRAVLESKGYRALIAPDGATGIEITRKCHIDAVVLRFASTGKDANQMADVLAKEQPELPVAVCSDFPDDIPESLKWFADCLLQAHAGPEALLSAIENLIVDREMVRKVAHRETFVSSEAA